MTDNLELVTPDDIKTWPTWAINVREEFVREAFLEQEPWDSWDDTTTKRVVECATAFVRALYPGLA